MFEVYEITENLSVDSLYYSDRVPAFIAEDLVADRGGSITPRPTLRPVMGSDTLAPQLRIRLSIELAERFLNAFGTSVIDGQHLLPAVLQGSVRHREQWATVALRPGGCCTSIS